ncbi:hypothetical protein FDP41_011934 [Naegleria fowleri]|uniref:DNA topoisomerase (ATP-hydrolyzing) n=1 Tax=Naegleria fowleri TaxID=5763 RepID=A0A6A5BVI9_NAEFO|nr:uncharacterized protein FDP41_011934 [Naegleria fowleri]KAF0982073.1 hypothetical protein FDP41_011934 [Naegleria fowleri]CAG4715751.1 unnamed protein product [Naegleria fowleri]
MLRTQQVMSCIEEQVLRLLRELTMNTEEMKERSSQSVLPAGLACSEHEEERKRRELTSEQQLGIDYHEGQPENQVRKSTEQPPLSERCIFFALKDLFNAHSALRFVSKLQLMHLILQLCVYHKFSTKRDMFYCMKPLMKTQTQCNQVLKELSENWNVHRHDLHVVPQSRGEVCGHVSFVQLSLNDVVGASTNETLTRNATDSRVINAALHISALSTCSIPSIPHLQIIGFDIPLEVDSLLIVEKESVFQQLKQTLEDKIELRKYILITSKGYPDVPTRDFIVTLVTYVAKYQKRALKIYLFTDGDPFGAEIAHVYIHGSKSFKNEKKYLTLLHAECEEACKYWLMQTYLNIQWIGVHLEEFLLENRDRGKLELNPQYKSCLLPLDTNDHGKIDSLLSSLSEFEHSCCEMLSRQLCFMKEYCCKVEIEALSFARVDYWTYILGKTSL